MDRLDVFRDAAVYCVSGRIRDIGPTPEVIRRIELAEGPGALGDIVHYDAGGRCAVPGLCDAHTHLVFSGTRADEYEQRIRGASYLEILASGGGILSTVRKTREASELDLFCDARARARKMAGYGTTTIEVKSGYGLDLLNEAKSLRVIARLNRELPLDFVPTLMAAHAVPPEFAGNSEGFVEYLLETVIPEIGAMQLAEFADVFCEKGVFTPEQSRRILLRSLEAGLRPKIHADEIESSGGAELACAIGAVSAEHLVRVSPQGIHDLARSETVAVLLPATSVFLGLHRPAPARDMIDSGVAVALATDCNPGTSPVFSMQLVMSLACSYLRMTAAEALTAATLNAAFAIGRGQDTGSLHRGKKADIVIIDAQDYREIPYFMGSNLASAVIKDGTVIACDGRSMF